MHTITRDFTATTFVIQENRTLLLWHNKIKAWLPPGGHIEPHELPEEAAVREVLEETGFEVELQGNHQRWGQVEVLRTPLCILLEDIEAGHQHIDLIYIGRITGGRLRLNLTEALDFRWYTYGELDSAEVGADIRILGQRAIEALGNPRGRGVE